MFKKQFGPYDDGLIFVCFAILTVVWQIFVSVAHVVETKGWI